MTLEPWDHEKHRTLLNAWGRARGLWLDVGPAEAYPPTGYCADSIAIGFMFLTNAPGVAYLDMFVTSPDTTREQRHEAIGAILDRFDVDAAAAGVRVLCAMTARPTLCELLSARGFSVHPDHHYATRGISWPH